VLIIAPVIAGAGIIGALIGMTGIGPKFSASLIMLAGGSMLALVILTWLSCYILGMGVSVTITYILLAILVAPALEEVGVPLMASHFFIFYVGLSMMFTPPFCPVAFVAAGFAGVSAFKVGFQAMRLGIVTYLIPLYLIFSPALIVMGAPLEMAVRGVTAVMGAFALSIGVERYLFTRANWLQTVLALASGILLIAPYWWSDIAGIGVLALVVFWQLATRKSRPLTKTGM
jgi:TRAP-type uncharacterized transport system fused permease subunit